MEDKALVSKCKLGDKDALRRIYEKYKRDLLILAVALLNDKTMAEDVLHDVFVAFVQNLDSFKLTGSLKAYLSVCIAYGARNKNRRKTPKDIDTNTSSRTAVEPNAPASAIICNEQLRQLANAMTQLAYEQREIIMLRTLSGMRFTAIADSQGISVNTVKSRYRYGIEKLREILEVKK